MAESLKNKEIGGTHGDGQQENLSNAHPNYGVAPISGEMLSRSSEKVKTANEKRLIDANAFSNEWWLAKFVEYKGRLRLVDTKLLRDIPTVDAVEVVRCKDCEESVYTQPTAGVPFTYCKKWVHCVHADDFCSYGERKGDGNV